MHVVFLFPWGVWTCEFELLHHFIPHSPLRIICIGVRLTIRPGRRVFRVRPVEKKGAQVDNSTSLWFSKNVRNLSLKIPKSVTTLIRIVSGDSNMIFHAHCTPCMQCGSEVFV